MSLLLHVAGSGRLDRPGRLAFTPWPLDGPALPRQLKRLAGELFASPAAFSGRLAGMALWRLRGEGDRSSADAHIRWRAFFDERLSVDSALHAHRLARLTTEPIFHVLLLSACDVLGVRQIAENLRRQIYPHWKLLVPAFTGTPDERARIVAMDARIRIAVAGECETFTGLGIGEGDLLLPCVPDLRLRPNAFLECAIARELFPTTKVIYGDHEVTSTGHDSGTPVFKSAWSPETFVHRDYLGDPVWYAADAALRWLGDGGRQDCASLRRFIATAGSEEIVHIPRVLALCPSDALPAQTNSRPSTEGSRVAMPGRPLVSIIIPTRDRAALLRTCIESLVARTRYPNFEIIIVDNESVLDETHRLLETLSARPEIRVLRHSGAFNYSALNNAAAAIAQGSVFALLNNDIEVLSEDWLDHMVDLATQERIGCVGAMLLYPGGAIQHAGLALGIGGGGAHLFRGLRPDDPAIGSYLDFARNVTAVTGACLVLRKALFQRVGGLDDADLAVSYNDVDLCLKVSALGYRNVWTPQARLVHHESLSRGSDDTPEKRALARYELAVMHKRWGTRMLRDPCYSPNLTAWADDMSIRDR